MWNRKTCTFYILVTLIAELWIKKRALSYSLLSCIIIHLARNVDKAGGVLMSIILPNLNYSFGTGFLIPDFPYAQYLRFPPGIIYSC